MMERSSKTLFLLTKQYPFGHGEQYVTEELNYLSQAFARVLIYPNDYYGDGKTHAMQLPANVEVLNFNRDFGKDPQRKSLSDVWYLASRSLQELWASDHKVYFLKNLKWSLINFWSQLQLAKRFSAYLRRQGYTSDNAVFYSYWFHKSAIFLSVLRDKGSINGYVSRAHSIDLYHHGWGMINDTVKVPPYESFKVKHVSSLISISEHGRAYLSKRHPSLGARVSAARLGVVENEPAPAKHEAGKFHIVTCSGFDVNKRVHLLARAIAKLDTPVCWTHFGDGALRNEVEQAIAAFPAHSEARLMGRVSNETVQRFYATNRVDLFVNLSRVEGIPVSIMEAMAAGIPVLATAVYGSPEAVIEGRNGFLLPPDFTVDLLAGKLRDCMAQPQQLRTFGENARQVYLERFSATKNYTAFANYLTTQ